MNKIMPAYLNTSGQVITRFSGMNPRAQTINALQIILFILIIIGLTVLTA